MCWALIPIVGFEYEDSINCHILHMCTSNVMHIAVSCILHPTLSEPGNPNANSICYKFRYPIGGREMDKKTNSKLS